MKKIQKPDTKKKLKIWNHLHFTHTQTMKQEKKKQEINCQKKKREKKEAESPCARPELNNTDEDNMTKSKSNYLVAIIY